VRENDSPDLFFPAPLLLVFFLSGRALDPPFPVAFDMDQTAVARHSQGRMKRGTSLEEFCNLVTPAFREIVPALQAAGIGLAIATHSDELELELKVKRHGLDPASYIIGSELVNAVLTTHFHDEMVTAFRIVAYNPTVRGTKDDEGNKVKRYHMRCLQQWFGVEAHEILFFDDIMHIVDDCAQACGVQAVLVDASVGFQYNDLLGWAEKQGQMKL
jgi:hypothetical protein